MRKRFAFYIFFVMLFASCKKTGGNSSHGSGTGGSNSMDLKVASFTPPNPYVIDELTITGTGFNTNKTSDTVIFNYQPATITSASATELKLQFPPEANMNMSV